MLAHSCFAHSSRQGKTEPKDLICSLIRGCILPERPNTQHGLCGNAMRAGGIHRAQPGLATPRAGPSFNHADQQHSPKGSPSTCPKVHQKLCLSAGLSANSVIQGTWDSSTDAGSHPKYRIDLPVASDGNPSLNTGKSSFSFMMNMRKFVSSCAKSHIMDV